MYGSIILVILSALILPGCVLVQPTEPFSPIPVTEATRITAPALVFVMLYSKNRLMAKVTIVFLWSPPFPGLLIYSYIFSAWKWNFVVKRQEIA